MVKKYQVQKEGELVLPVMKGYKMGCCDCGLVHKVDFVVIDKCNFKKDGSYSYKELKGKKLGVGMRVWRDERATSAHRRERKKKNAKV